MGLCFCELPGNNWNFQPRRASSVHERFEAFRPIIPWLCLSSPNHPWLYLNLTALENETSFGILRITGARPFIRISTRWMVFDERLQWQHCVAPCCSDLPELSGND